jgi:hypothetical protein
MLKQEFKSFFNNCGADIREFSTAVSGECPGKTWSANFYIRGRVIAVAAIIPVLFSQMPSCVWPYWRAL